MKHSLLKYLSNRPLFLWVYWHNKPVGRTQKKLVNHEPIGTKWFTSFLSVLPTSQVVYCASKPIERMVSCLYEITIIMVEVYQWEENLLYFLDQVAYCHQILEMMWQTNHSDWSNKSTALYQIHDMMWQTNHITATERMKAQYSTQTLARV